MTAPASREEFTEWFANRDYDMDAMMCVFDYGSRDGEPHKDNPSYLWEQILAAGLFNKKGMSAYNMWISRSGRIYSCHWASHERLLDIMGLDTWEAEEAGWIRVSGMNGPTSVQGKFRPTGKQIRAMKKIGADLHIKPDAEWVDRRPRHDMIVLTVYE